MFIQKKDGSVICSQCEIAAKLYIEHRQELNQFNSDYFFEPWDESEINLYICQGCGDLDYISDSESDIL
jgi:hypothetical protein